MEVIVQTPRNIINLQPKSLIKIIDLFGRETKEIVNQTLFYIYDDGSVKKKIIIE